MTPLARRVERHIPCRQPMEAVTRTKLSRAQPARARSAAYPGARPTRNHVFRPGPDG